MEVKLPWKTPLLPAQPAAASPPCRPPRLPRRHRLVPEASPQQTLGKTRALVGSWASWGLWAPNQGLGVHLQSQGLIHRSTDGLSTKRRKPRPRLSFQTRTQGLGQRGRDRAAEELHRLLKCPGPRSPWPFGAFERMCSRPEMQTGLVQLGEALPLLRRALARDRGDESLSRGPVIFRYPLHSLKDTEIDLPQREPGRSLQKP